MQIFLKILSIICLLLMVYCLVRHFIIKFTDTIKLAEKIQKEIIAGKIEDCPLDMEYDYQRFAEQVFHITKFDIIIGFVLGLAIALLCIFGLGEEPIEVEFDDTNFRYSEYANFNVKLYKKLEAFKKQYAKRFFLLGLGYSFVALILGLVLAK